MKTKTQLINEAYEYYTRCGLVADQEDIVRYISELYPERLTIK